MWFGRKLNEVLHMKILRQREIYIITYLTGWEIQDLGLHLNSIEWKHGNYSLHVKQAQNEL